MSEETPKNESPKPAPQKPVEAPKPIRTKPPTDIVQVRGNGVKRDLK